MDLRKLKTLIDLVSDSTITELEITEADGKVRIVKSSPVAYAAPGFPPAAPALPPQPAPVAPLPETPAAPAAEAGHVVKSPMVGTFYRSATPGSAPFVDIGTTVKEGQTICIVEAMKIMNEIEADLSGTVVKVLAENGQAVEFGQPLFLIQ